MPGALLLVAEEGPRVVCAHADHAVSTAARTAATPLLGACGRLCAATVRVMSRTHGTGQASMGPIWYIYRPALSALSTSIILITVPISRICRKTTPVNSGRCKTRPHCTPPPSAPILPPPTGMHAYAHPKSQRVRAQRTSEGPTRSVRAPRSQIAPPD